MSERIKLLPEAVANQIAAGEVVNRPASVVKEMMENAVDAGGKNITVCFRDGGKSLIHIVDDGCGMTPADARMAFERHATSKISNVEDIYNLSTFGFRGEALASIAAVAEVQLKTRTHDEQVGTQVEISAGKFVSQHPVSCPAGSQFFIRNLFYNIPARRRFLEKSSTESRHITAEYQRVALCNPQIGFALYDGDSLISKLPPSSLRQRIAGVIGKNIGKNILEVTANTSIVKLEGFTGRPESARQNNREQFLFVNGRYFKSPYFHKAVISAYDKLIQPNTQPSYFLYITIDPLKIDVNVHPQKTEVKFTDGSDIWQIINAAVRETLAKSGAVPALDFNLDTSVKIPVTKKGAAIYSQPRITANPEFNPFEKYGDDIEPYQNERLLPELDPSPEDFSDRADDYTGTGKISSRRFIAGVEYIDSPVGIDAGDESGDFFEDDSLIEFVDHRQAAQGELPLKPEEKNPVMRLGQRYFTTVVDGNLAMVDIPRALEAVLFDRFITMLNNGSSASQQLLFPETLAMSLDDISLVMEFADGFASFGFDLRIQKERGIEVRAVPADFTDLPLEQLIYDLLDAMRDGTGGQKMRKHKAASALASIGSMSRWTTKSDHELRELLTELSSCANPSYTPSGKKVMTILTEQELRKKLG
ncbi:MAG: DNA mismatch repair endonuclease MutL [Rikenellaceae bacterium]|nr:DNA mismatch repair endonuclease MutL [Rikenellaceae bacterium]